MLPGFRGIFTYVPVEEHPRDNAHCLVYLNVNPLNNDSQGSNELVALVCSGMDEAV